MTKSRLSRALKAFWRELRRPVDVADVPFDPDNCVAAAAGRWYHSELDRLEAERRRAAIMAP